MIKLRTIKQAAELVKAEDNDTALNENFLRTLAENGQICSHSHGNRLLVDMELLCVELWRLANIKNAHYNRRFPTFRSIRDATNLIKSRDPETAVNEELLRKFAKEGRIHTIVCGTKQIVVMESFLLPYTLMGIGTGQAKGVQKPQAQRRESTSVTEHYRNLLDRSEQPFKCKREVG